MIREEADMIDLNFVHLGDILEWKRLVCTRGEY